MPKNNLYFCWRNKDKASLCKTLEITHFVDDSIDVLRHLRIVKYRYALNPKKKEVNRYPETIKSITIVKSWEELLPLLLT